MKITEWCINNHNPTIVIPILIPKQKIPNITSQIVIVISFFLAIYYIYNLHMTASKIRKITQYEYNISLFLTHLLSPHYAY